jgi:hypothetical protein
MLFVHSRQQKTMSSSGSYAQLEEAARGIIGCAPYGPSNAYNAHADQARAIITSQWSESTGTQEANGNYGDK